MSALARTIESDCYTRAANEDCINGGPRTRTKYAYDAANRLVSGLIGTGTPQFQYVYDHASNLTSISANGTTQGFSFTSTNTITAGSYDANGSPISLQGAIYKWDGDNRIASVANTSNNTASSFMYDGLGRLVRVVDTHAGAITADHSYTWCGATRCLAHDNTQTNSPVSTQYFDQGVIVNGVAFYYLKDRLGSVTALVNSSGTVSSQYSYDPYGNQTIVSGVSSDIGFAGYFHHAQSGLDFAVYRAYDPVHSRWLNRDPLGEMAGINMYLYVTGYPTSIADSSGLSPHTGGFHELYDQVSAVGLKNAYIAKQDAATALQGAQSSGLDGLHNGPADAYRHCLWSCLMTQDIGADNAQTVGDTHEKNNNEDGQPKAEEQMDQANNAVGRSCGLLTDTRSCADRCMDSLLNGQLNGLGGTPMRPPHAPSPNLDVDQPDTYY
jgi:RHS repeat-associated protein